MSDTDEYYLRIRTIQTSAIRILVEALKEILTDTNIIFDDTGIKIITTDSTKTVLIHMKLEKEKFEEYFCEKKMICGISMINLYKLIKTISNQDTLTLFIKIGFLHAFSNSFFLSEYLLLDSLSAKK